MIRTSTSKPASRSLATLAFACVRASFEPRVPKTTSRARFTTVSRRFGAVLAVQLQRAREGQDVAAHLSEGFKLLDGAVEELVDEGVAHLLDGSGLLGREAETLEGAGDLVAPDALGAVPQLLDQRYDVQGREPAHVLQDGGPYHGLPCRSRRGS